MRLKNLELLAMGGNIFKWLISMIDFVRKHLMSLSRMRGCKCAGFKFTSEEIAWH